ncbi:hypothetical protein [Dyadobacter sp. CY356]|nr:hypothetical protein [Dyadobacter sp. CY356]
MEEFWYLIEILEDIEDEIAIESRKDEECFDWNDVREKLLSQD